MIMYKRVWREQTILVALSTVHHPRKLELPPQWTQLLSTYLDGEGAIVSSSRLLRASEGLIVKL